MGTGQGAVEGDTMITPIIKADYTD
jgi:hypothetical protein